MAEGVEVEGLREAVRKLESYGAQVADLKAAFNRIGTLVTDEAKRRAPKKSGALANSIRPSNAKNKSVIRAGSARVPYARVQEYGWPRRNITGKHYMENSVAAKHTQVIQTLEAELKAIAARLGL